MDSRRWNGIVRVFLLTSVLVPIVTGGIEVRGAESNLGMNQTEKNAKTLVVLGASYAGGWPSDRQIAGYQIINKGVSGQQSFEMLARFEGDVLALKPNAVIIWGFINDIFRSERTQIDQTIRRTHDSILAMVQLARKAGVVPILATEVTIRGKDGWSEAFESLIGRMLGKSSYQDYVNGYVIETNRWIRDLAVREGILLLDLETVLADRRSVRRKEYSLPDGSHISPQGYEALMRYSDDRIKASLGSK